MSLIGIDVGSSAVKVGAYRPDGTRLRHTRIPLTARHRHPGWWELEPTQVWAAVWEGLRATAADPAVLRDPPEALAISASGREAFPVAADGSPLGPCLMAGDRRLPEPVPALAGVPGLDDLERWVARCGHAPSPSDPVLRLLWWRQNWPESTAHAGRFLDWHAYLTGRLGGRAVTDHTLAAGWLVYDQGRGDWSEELLATLRIPVEALPEIAAAGTVVAELAADLARQLGWRRLPIVTGAFDAAAAGIGAGAGDRVAALACGSWETLLQPVGKPLLTPELARRGDLLTPYPGPPGWAVYAPRPQGGAVVEWARQLLRLERADLHSLVAGRREPSSAMAVGSFVGEDGYDPDRLPGSVLKGLSLAVGAAEVIQAVFEAIAYELAESVASLARVAGRPEVIRATGGGAINDWWMQLKADLTGLPIEVTAEPAASSLGAGMLAGLGAGRYPNLTEATTAAVSVTRRFEPDPDRADRHAARQAQHRRGAGEPASGRWLFPVPRPA